MKDINIIKRNGQKEPFDKHKIERVLKAAGLTVDEAKKSTKNIVTTISHKNQHSMHAKTLRNIVLDELKRVNQYAAGLYEWYEETK